MMYVLVILVILLSVWAYKRYRRLTLLRRYGIPGPAPSFIFGNGLQLREANVLQVNKWIREYGKVFGMWDLSPVVMVADPDLLSQIQVRDFPLFHMRRTFIEKGGFDANPDYECSIISSDITPERWKEQRSLISTSFTSSKLKKSAMLIDYAIDHLVDNIMFNEQLPDFDVQDLFQRFAMDTIGSSAFGIQIHSQVNPRNKLFIATKQFFEDFTKDLKQLPLYFLFMFPEFFPLIYPIRRIQRQLNVWLGIPSFWSIQTEICSNIVAERKARRTDIFNNYARDDLLQRMIEASLTSEQIKSINLSGEGWTEELDQRPSSTTSTTKRSKGKMHQMNDREIVANACVLFDAGYETTSTTLSFLTHVLVNNLMIQKRIRKEVRRLIKRDGRLDYNVMNELPFLDSVIYETLRLYPPLTNAVTRQSTVEYEYKGFRIPANTSIMVPVHYMQRDPDFWEDPETFDPLRFFGENKWRTSSPSFQAFGFGPRNCVGMRFALMEVKLVIARILTVYRLVPGPRTESFKDLQISYKQINEVPKNGIFIKVIPLNNSIRFPFYPN